MPKTETANHATERAKLATQPVYIVRFFWLNKVGDGTDYRFTRDFASFMVTGQTDKILAVYRISGNSQTVEPEQGRSSQGSFTIELLNYSGEIMRYLSAPALTLKTAMTAGSPTDGGFVELNEDPSGLPAVGTIKITTGSAFERVRYDQVDVPNKKVRVATSGRGVDGTTAASHSIGDAITNGEQIRAGMRCQIFSGYAQLAEADYMAWPKMEVAEVGMDDDHTKFLIRVNDLQRWLKKRVFTSATPSAKVSLTGNPLTLMLQILLSTGTATNGPYDVLAAVNGLAIPQALIDVVGLESLRDTEFASQTFQCSISAPEEGKTFIEREFLKINNCIPIIKQDGKWSAKRLKPAPDPGSVSLTLTQTEIISWRWNDGARFIINEAEFFYDYDADSANPNAFAKRQRYRSTKSIDDYGLRQALIFESKGILTAQGGQALLDDRAFMLFKRYADPPPVLEVDVFYMRNTLEIGDAIKVSHPEIPNKATGALGLTNAVFEIVDLTPFFGIEGKVRLALLYTGSITLPSAPTSGGAVSIPSDTRDMTAPAMPTGLALTPTGDLLTDGTFLPFVEADWNDNAETDLAYYTIEWRVKPPSGDPPWTAAGGSKESRYSIKALKPNTQYQVRVRAYDTSNNASVYSTIVETTTQADPGAPATPSGVSAAGFILDIRVAWSANAESDITGYNIERADDSGFTIGVVTRATKHESTFFLDTDLGRGITKYYRVYAVRRTGAISAASSVVSATTAGIGASEIRIDVAVITVAAQIANAIIGNAHVNDLSADKINAGTLAVARLSASLAYITATAQIADAVITTAKIGDAQITSAKIGNLQVKSANIEDLTVGTAKIADNAVTENKAASGSGVTVGASDTAIADTGAWSNASGKYFDLASQLITLSWSSMPGGTTTITYKIILGSQTLGSKTFNITTTSGSAELPDIVGALTAADASPFARLAASRPSGTGTVTMSGGVKGTLFKK